MSQPLKLQKLKGLPIWVLFSTDASNVRDEDRLWYMLRKRDGELPAGMPSGSNAKMTLHPELTIWQSNTHPSSNSNTVKFEVVFKWEDVEYEHRTVEDMTEFTFHVKPDSYKTARVRNTERVSFAWSDPNEFPLAKKLGSMTAIRIRLAEKHIPADRLIEVSDKQFMGRRHLRDYIQMNLEAISAESKAAEEKINGQEREGCTVRYHAYRGFIVAQIEPTQAATGAWDISSGQRVLLTNPEPDADSGEDVLGVRIESELPFPGSVVGIVEDRVDVQKYDGLVQEGIHVTVDFADPTADRHADAIRKLSEMWGLRKTEGPIASSNFDLAAIFVKGQEQDLRPVAVSTTARPVLPDTWQIDESQREAIMSAHNPPGGVALGQGGPGCGKTATSSHLVLSLIQSYPKIKVMYVVVTKSGLDTALNKCATFSTRYDVPFKACRVYSRSQIGQRRVTRGLQISMSTTPYDLDVLRLRIANLSPVKWAQYLSGIEEIDRDGTIQDEGALALFEEQSGMLDNMVLEGTQVLFVTCTNSGLKLLRKFKADYLIVDEVASAKDPDVLLPILSQPSLRAAYFTGDHKQNGPVLLTGEGSRAWDVTPMERMIDAGWPYTLVRIQYRTHQALANHTSVRFYDGRIIPSSTTVDRPFIARFFEGAARVRFFDDSGRAFSLNSTKYVFNVHEGQNVVSKSVSNRQEALVVSTLVQGLMKMGIAPAEVVVLTPYRDQVDLLRKIRAEHGWTSQVETSDKFQGSEAEVVIFSFVRADGTLGFLHHPRRINVATSRAREVFIAVGHEPTMSKRVPNKPCPMADVLKLLGANAIRVQGTLGIVPY